MDRRGQSQFCPPDKNARRISMNMIRLNLTAIKVKAALAICALMLLAHGAPAQVSSQVISQSMSQAVALKSQTLRYSIKYGKHNAGELEIVIERSQQQIKTTAISHLNILARMFITGLTVENWFDIEREKVHLKSGHTLSHGSKTVERSFVIDRKQGLIKLQPGEQVIPINIDEIFESPSFPITLITSDIESIQGQTVREISPKRIREYVYLAPEQHTLTLNGRRFETWKVTRQKLGEATRTVTLWLDKHNQQIPVKIITTKKNNDTVITLLSAA